MLRSSVTGVFSELNQYCSSIRTVSDQYAHTCIRPVRIACLSCFCRTDTDLIWIRLVPVLIQNVRFCCDTIGTIVANLPNTVHEFAAWYLSSKCGCYVQVKGPLYLFPAIPADTYISSYYPVHISTTVFSYSCAVQHHTILHGCYCMGQNYVVS